MNTRRRFLGLLATALMAPSIVREMMTMPNLPPIPEVLRVVVREEIGFTFCNPSLDLTKVRFD